MQHAQPYQKQSYQKNETSVGTLGVVTGLAAEARLVAPHQVVCTAAQPSTARALIEGMITGGVQRLLSFGLAGGLAPNLPAGSIVIASHVASRNGAQECEAAWVRQLVQALPEAHVGGVWGHDAIVARQGDKADLYAASKALVCDMESHYVASAAAATAVALSFVVVRVVCDPADFSLPPAALLPLQRDGSPNLRAIMLALARQPTQLPALVRLGGYHQRAMRALVHVASVLR